MSAPRALVLRALGLGDLLAGVPALRAVRAALPDHELVLAAPAVLRPLVDLVGAVDRLLATEELAPVPWTGAPPDVAVDLHGNGPATKALLQALGPRRLVAFAGPGADGAHVPGPGWDVEEHERRRWCRLVATAFDVEADPNDLRLRPPEQAPPLAQAVVVHAGAASASRRWPAERFAEVARWAAAAGERVVLTGSAEEAHIAQRVRRRAGLGAEAVLAGCTDLAGLAALVASARLVVSGDTGIAHLASAYRTPSVVLFGPTPPRRWGPPGDGPHAVLWHGARPNGGPNGDPNGDPDGDRNADWVGDPHGDTVDPALLAVTVAEVVDRARVTLGSAPATAPRRSTARSG